MTTLVESSIYQIIPIILNNDFIFNNLDDIRVLSLLCKNITPTYIGSYVKQIIIRFSNSF